MKYAPGIVPKDPEQLQSFLQNELIKIQQVIEQINIFEVYHVEPTKPQDGMVVYADGTDWNPSSGEGLYVYYNSGWNSLG